MNILGVGPLEFIFIILIALIILGPNDMVKAGRTIGKFIRNLVTSPGWRTIQATSRDLKYLPNKLMREAGLEEPLKEVSEDIQNDMRELDQEIKAAVPTNADLSVDLNQLNSSAPKKPAATKIVKEDPSDWTKPPVIIESPEPPETSATPAGNSTAPETK